MAFRSTEAKGIDSEHDDALVITARISNVKVRRVMIDIVSSTDVLYWQALKRMGHTEVKLSPYDNTLSGFTGDAVRPMGMIDLHVTVGSAPRTRTVKARFLVVDLPAVYNAILGRPTLNKLRAV